LETIGFGTE
jgi:structural maintenance of chromosome 2